MRINLRDCFIIVGIVSIFLGWTIEESREVILSLAIYTVSALLGGFFAFSSFSLLIGQVKSACKHASLRPILERLRWGQLNRDGFVVFLAIVCIATANFAISESANNPIPMVVIMPLTGMYFGWAYGRPMKAEASL